MYDDIANNTMNPRPGVIINNPHGQDVYKGVPKVCIFFLSSLFDQFNPSKILRMCVMYVDEGRVIFLLRQDYVGEDVNAENFFNVILANKSGITGGSGKVLNSAPNDHIFIYYVDHGGPGIVCK